MTTIQQLETLAQEPMEIELWKKVSLVRCHWYEKLNNPIHRHLAPLTSCMSCDGYDVNCRRYKR